MILAASAEPSYLAELKSDGDYFTDEGIDYRGGAYGASKVLDDGRLLGTNTVNPMVDEKINVLSGDGCGASIKHELLENISGILNSTDSSPAT